MPSSSFQLALAEIILLLGLITSLASTLQIEEPSVGVYQTNFKDEITKVFSEERNGEIILPTLEQSYYTETTFQLVCNATYPVQWIYSSSIGTPKASATTTRIASNRAAARSNRHNEEFQLFQAKVTFSFMDKSQEGNYSCQRIAEPTMSAFVYLKVIADTAMAAIEDPKAKPGPKLTRRNLTMSLIGTNSGGGVICCSHKHTDFLKMRFMKCESVSDCRLKQMYMENNVNCTQHYCHQDRVTTTQIDGETCSVFDMSDDDDEYDHDDDLIGTTYSTEFQQGIFQCSGGGADVQNEYLTFTRLDGSIVSDYTKLPRPLKHILQIQMEPISKESSDVFLTCNANSFYFSHGLKWAFQNTSQSYTFYDKGAGKVSLRFPKQDIEGKIAHCFAPVWNSNEWKRSSMIL